MNILQIICVATTKKGNKYHSSVCYPFTILKGVRAPASRSIPNIFWHLVNYLSFKYPIVKETIKFKILYSDLKTKEITLIDYEKITGITIF